MRMRKKRSCAEGGDAAKRSPIEFVPDTGTNTLLIAGLGNKVKAGDSWGQARMPLT